MNAKNGPDFDVGKELARDLFKLVEAWEERQRTMAAYGTMTHQQYAQELKKVLLKFWPGGRPYSPEG